MSAGRAVLLLALAGLLAASCDRVTGPKNSGRPEPLTGLPRALTIGERRVLTGSNSFAFGLLREVVRADPGSNVFLSPLSASMALGMTMNGAVGPTLDGMRSALGFGSLPLSDVDSSYHSLINLLRGLDNGVDFRLANSIWARQGFPFRQSFYDATRQYFDARTAELDFSSPSAAQTINDWVKQSTGGKIESIVDPPIPAEVVMYLINAVYFKGSWRDRFDASATTRSPFTRADGTVATVDMMHRTGAVAYFQAAGARGVELPYGRGAYVMDIVLPENGRTLGDLVAGLDTTTWHQWLAAADTTEVVLSLPRFTLTNDRLLNDPLIRLGMDKAFTPDVADFTAMSPVGDRLYISKVKQKTFVAVNEEGTEAAAATSVEVSLTSMPLQVVFRVDRPFLVAIRERFSGTIVFIGAIGAV